MSDKKNRKPQLISFKSILFRVAFAILSYFLIQILYKGEEWIIHKTSAFDPIQIILDTPKIHLFSFLLWIALVLFAAVFINKIVQQFLKNEVKTQNIIDSAVDGIITINEKGIIEDFNPAAQRIFGYFPDEIIGKNVSVLMPEPYHSAHDKYINNYIRTGIAKIIGIGRETIGQRKDKTIFPIELSVSKVFIDNHYLFTGMVRDISARKKIESKLAKQYERQSALADFDMIVNQSQEMQTILDRAVKVAASQFPANRCACIILLEDQKENAFFCSSDSLDKKRKSLSEQILQHPDILQKIIHKNQILVEPNIIDSKTDLNVWLRKNKIQSYVGAPLCADKQVIGVLFAFNHNPMGFNNEDLEFLKALSNRTAVAVSKFRLYDDLQRTNTSLKNQKGELFAVLDSTNEAILLLSPEGKVITANTNFADMLGVNIEEIINHRYDEYNSLFERLFGDTKLFQPLISSINDDSMLQFSDFLVQQWPIHRDLALFSTQVRTSDEKYLGRLFVLRDITHEREADRVKSEFVSSVSHELRTPLTSIHGSLGLISGGAAGEISEKIKPLIDIAYNNSERLIRLINDILDIEKIGTGEMTFSFIPCELMPLLEKAVELNRSFGEQYGVNFKIESSLPGVKVNVDCDRFIQVVTNLLSNAAKFSNTGDQVEILVSHQKEFIQISIVDHGLGIPREFRNRIFQRFAQADSPNIRKKGGTGLGLSISKAIVEKMGGLIGYKSEENLGTTFYFTLPEWKDEIMADVPERGKNL